MANTVSNTDKQNGRWIIWPQTKFLTEDQIRTMLSDAIANEKTAIDDPNSFSLDEVCVLLMDIGVATFSNGNPNSLANTAHNEAMELEAELEQ